MGKLQEQVFPSQLWQGLGGTFGPTGCPEAEVIRHPRRCQWLGKAVLEGKSLSFVAGLVNIFLLVGSCCLWLACFSPY